MSSQPAVEGKAGYEFTPAQDQVMADLAKKMSLVGKVLLVFGVIGVIAGLLLITSGGVGALIQGTLNIFIGLWTARASRSFSAIVETKGNDIHHLMNAMENLSKRYGLEYYIIIIALILLVIFIVIALLALFFGIGSSIV